MSAVAKGAPTQGQAASLRSALAKQVSRPTDLDMAAKVAGLLDHVLAEARDQVAKGVVSAETAKAIEHLARAEITLGGSELQGGDR